ncbi:Lysine/arginine permease [Penicillium chrysogenum]|uniref:Lysine/arginine permease n=1 Tax=Penicillium chrysogenum TaxID=5076 RepID=A0A167VWQ3_PENCH|nr:Lysine/arginine permease [Penicillium chrysogenum]
MSQPAEAQLVELPAWARPWLSGVLPTRMEQIPSGSPHPRSQNSFLRPPNHSPSLISAPSSVSTDSEDTGILTKCPEERLVVGLSRERTVSRALKGVHIFMITVNATLGTGLYWRGGQILELGGPLAVVLSFLFIGILTWGVMQCITEMLCIWPIPGALSVYVSQFVDEELGIAVGVTYWTREELLTTIKDWTSPTAFDTRAANNWGTALLMSISIATFAYTGVEVVAASALEARWLHRADEMSPISDKLSRSNDVQVRRSFKFSAIFIPVLAMVAYTISGLLATLDIERKSCALPRLSWLSVDVEAGCTKPSNSAAFVAIATMSNIPHLADVFNAFLVFTCLSCAGTNLYVASRALFGLTSRLDGGEGQRWYLRVFAWFGKTDRRKVPLRAMIFSAVAFWWVPFLQLIRGSTQSSATTDSSLKGTRASVDMFVEVLSQMAYSAVLIVWACECLAFIRFYHCISRHRDYLRREHVAHVQRWSDGHDDYPYRSHRQPLTAYLAFLGCVFVSLVANGAALWNGFHLLPFLASYLTIIVFVGLWVLLKIMRGAKWSLVDLSQPDKVARIFRHLHDIRLSVTQS